MFDKHLSHPSGFFVRPWQCCHCLKYCLCPKKALKNDSPYSSHCWRGFFSPVDTIPRADTKTSLFVATSPCSFQVLSSPLCSLLLTRPLPVSFPPGCPDSFWQGRNTRRSSLMKLCWPGSIHLNQGQRKYLGKYPQIRCWQSGSHYRHNIHSS